MNTSSKGTFYEKQTYSLFKKLLYREELYVPSHLSDVRYKPHYYSPDRKKEIEFDVSIETRMVDLEDFSLLTIIECKNYKGKVPVDDLARISHECDN